MDLFGKDFVVTQDWSLKELQALLDLRDLQDPRHDPLGGGKAYEDILQAGPRPV